MIRRITGTVETSAHNAVEVVVGGIGYRVYTNPGGVTLTPGSEVTFYTYLAVRENAMDLYGFLAEAERAMFELLIELPKIGPKSALQILTQADVTLLQKAIAQNDAVLLSKMSGISKKSAEKIVGGLKDKEEAIASWDIEGGARVTGSDVVDALIALGYSEKQARDAAAAIPEDVTDTNAQIKEALKQLSSYTN